MKRQENDEFEPVKVSIVELDKDSEDDVKALYKTSILWLDQGAKYSSNIYHEAVKGYEYDDIEREHYFALTTQNEGFNKLDSEKILGLMLFSNTRHDTDQICWFQVRPNTNTTDSWQREYKGVGKSMMDLIKVINYNKPIYVQSSDKAVEFYKKQGFIVDDKNTPSCLTLYV